MEQKPLNKEDIKVLVRKAAGKVMTFTSAFVVGSGAACVMYGIRETTDDVDINISVHLYNLLVSEGYKVIANDGHPVYVPYVEIIPRVGLHAAKERGLVCTIDGIACMTLDALFAQKISFNRDKDQADILALRKLLSDQTQSTCYGDV